MLDATVAYAKVREQFGRPIGSFQAVKHACADMLVQIAVARELVAAAVEAARRPARPRCRGRGVDGQVVRRAPRVDDRRARPSSCTAASATRGRAASTSTSKRATLDRSLFGSPAAHRRRLAARLPG